MPSQLSRKALSDAEASLKCIESYSRLGEAMARIKEIKKFIEEAKSVLKSV